MKKVFFSSFLFIPYFVGVKRGLEEITGDIGARRGPRNIILASTCYQYTRKVLWMKKVFFSSFLFIPYFVGVKRGLEEITGDIEPRNIILASTCYQYTRKVVWMKKVFFSSFLFIPYFVGVKRGLEEITGDIGARRGPRNIILASTCYQGRAGHRNKSQRSVIQCIQFRSIRKMIKN